MLSNDMKNYHKVSNEIVGVIFLTLFLGSLGTDNPQITAILLSPIALSALLHMRNNYPPEARKLQIKLQTEQKGTRRNSLQSKLDKIYKEHFPLKAIFTRDGLYMLSALYYFLLLIMPQFGGMIKNLTSH